MPARPTNVPLVTAAYRRPFAGGVELRLDNRFYEADPSTADNVSLVARPGTTPVANLGVGPTIRALFTQEGVFNDDLFLVSGDGFYRYDGETLTLINGAVGFDATFPSIAVQASPGVERIWLADGEDLFYYEGLSRSQATLLLSGDNVADGDIVQIAGVYYEWVDAGVDDGTPDGSMSNPWRVLLGATGEFSLGNLNDAIGNAGTPGSTYSSDLVENPDVQVRRLRTDRIIVEARVAGTAGDSISVTETSSTLAWVDAVGDPTTTLVNGGLNFLTRIELPEGTDDAKALAVASVSGFIIVAGVNSQRLYFIFPGEFWTDTFAEAEAEPDQIVTLKAVGDFLWVFGRSTIEPWAASGEEDTPFAPIRGRALRFGAVEDTVAVLDSRLFYVDTTNIVRDENGTILSTPDVSEKIRLRG